MIWKPYLNNQNVTCFHETLVLFMYIAPIKLLLPTMISSQPYRLHFVGNLFQTQLIGFNLV